MWCTGLTCKPLSRAHQAWPCCNVSEPPTTTATTSTTTTTALSSLQNKEAQTLGHTRARQPSDSPLFCCRKFPLLAWLTFATKSRRRSISGACRRGRMQRQPGAPGGWSKQEECALFNCHRGGTNSVGVCRRSSRSARVLPGSPGALTFSIETPGRCCRACVFLHAPPSADV